MRIIQLMSDDHKPNPLDDVSKGLGLLFRAAKTTVERLPTDKLEDFVTEGAKEVGRALETVGGVIEREVLGVKTPGGAPGAPHADANASAPAAASGAKANAAPPKAAAPQAGSSGAGSSSENANADDAPRGPRIG